MLLQNGNSFHFSVIDIQQLVFNSSRHCFTYPYMYIKYVTIDLLIMAMISQLPCRENVEIFYKPYVPARYTSILQPCREAIYHNQHSTLIPNECFAPVNLSIYVGRSTTCVVIQGAVCTEPGLLLKSFNIAKYV